MSGLLLGMPLLVVGFFAIVGGMSGWKRLTQRKAGNAVRIETKCIGERVERSPGEGTSSAHYLTLEWHDRDDNTHQREFKVSWLEYSTPEYVGVLFDPDHPETVVLDRWSNKNRMAPVGVIVLGVATLLAGLVLISRSIG